MPMMRVLAFVFLIVATAMAYFQLDEHPAWADFQVPVEETSKDVTSVASPSTLKTKPASTPPILHGLTEWLPDTTRPSVHAASVIPLKDGNWRAFWFAGSREGAADVVILSAVWDSVTKQWGPASVVLDREGAQASLGRYIAKLGNPVPMRNINGQLQLYVVAVSIGGWAGSSISVMHSGFCLMSRSTP